MTVRPLLSSHRHTIPQNERFISLRPCKIVASVLLVVAASLGTATETAGASSAESGEARHGVPLFLLARSLTGEGRQSFVRIVNRAGEGGSVRIDAFDDDGMQYGPLTLEIGAGETVHFNSNDLEQGNTDKGLTGATGSGEGSWRLALTQHVGHRGVVVPAHA